MKQDEFRRSLIDGTIHIIARDGLEKASTKQIGLTTGINEAYIYRCFKDKEDMFAKTFESLDNELVTVSLEHVSVMYLPQMEYKMRCWTYFTSVWKFILGNKEKCITFMRYYYSPYFSNYSAAEHKKRYEPLVEKFKDAFRDEANVRMILNYILTTMLVFAIKVFDGEVPDNSDTQEHVFRLIYFSIRQYFKERET